MPRYRRYFAPGQTVFLTLVAAHREPWMAAPGVRSGIMDALRAVRCRHPFRHHGHVLLDDHLHLLLSPSGGTAVAMLVGSLKRAVMARIDPCHGPRLWQRRYFDHVIRDDADLRAHLDYLHFNPVKHGLVARAGDWHWSSLRAWIARGAYGEDWGVANPENLAAYGTQPWTRQAEVARAARRAGTPEPEPKAYGMSQARHAPPACS